MTWPPLPNPYYADDAVALYLGDCLEGMAALPDRSVSMVLTDPPYGHNNNNGDLIHNQEKALGKPERFRVGGSAGYDAESRPIANDGDEAEPLFRAMLAEAYRVMEDGCCCCCCCCGGGGPDPMFARWSLAMDELFRFKQMLVWDKGGLGMGWHYRRSYETVLVAEKGAGKWRGGNSQSNVLRVPKIIPQAHDHPTPKPVGLMSILVGCHTDPGDIILDPFTGSGPVPRAAKDLGRRCIGIEIDERWLEMAAKRCAQEVLFA